MYKLHTKTIKRVGRFKIPFTRLVFSFIGLCAGVMVLLSTLQMSVVFDMSFKMMSHGISYIDDFVDNYSAIYNINTSTNEWKMQYIFGKTLESNDSGRRRKCSSCFQHNFNYLINNEIICKLYSANQTIDLFIFIFTTHKNIKERAALRSTWLSHTKNNTANVRYAFLLGEISDNKRRKAVNKENNVHHDIIKEDFVDTYMNLTYKTIMGFKWAATKCAHAHHVMKTDDDMFVNIQNVLKLFNETNIKKLQRSTFGICLLKGAPIRNKKSKWFASNETYPESSYPGYCSGTGYVTSMRVTQAVYDVSSSIPFFHLEDVYVGLCMKQLGFEVQTISGFHMDRPKPDPCVYKGEQLITSHRLTPAMLHSIWNKRCVKK